MNEFIKEGGRSFHENQGRYANPYSLGSSRYDDFERGFFQALKRSPDSAKSTIEETDSSSDRHIEDYEHEKRVVYEGETYCVRDNGAILRVPRKDGRRRRLDGEWTFGRPCKQTGYMRHSGQVVHRIVASAFHGESPGNNYVVDHIDTNRRNNRPENLRWLTRLDNLLMNPVTRRRIDLSYGSVEEFLKNPANPKRKGLPKNFEWMRTVSKDEARASRERLLSWAESGKVSQGGSIGEWIYGPMANEAQRPLDTIKESLTTGAVQRNWAVPSEFPLCPDPSSRDVLNLYHSRLSPGEVFSLNQYGSSEVVVSSMGNSGQISVITKFHGNPVKDYAVALVSTDGESIIYESAGTFFTLQGAAKAHCEHLDVAGEAYCERHDLPWGESIDDYC